MNKIIYYSILLEMIFCLGIKSLYIPQNAILVGTSSTGLAISPELNPANICLNKSFFSFSNNDWLANVKGQKISMLFQSKLFFDNSYMSMETLNSKNIEIRDNTHTDDPLGYFGAYWYAFEFAQSKHLSFTSNLKFLESEPNNLRLTPTDLEASSTCTTVLLL